jgi:hypothetical protein
MPFSRACLGSSRRPTVPVMRQDTLPHLIPNALRLVSGTRHEADVAEGPAAEHRDTIRLAIPYIIDMLKDKDPGRQLAAASALSKAIEYRELKVSKQEYGVVDGAL